MSASEGKRLLTVSEAAEQLRIGRSTAYDLAHAWLDSGGTKGLPVVRIEGSLRVPAVAIDRLIAVGGFGTLWQSGLDGRRRTRKVTGTTGPKPKPGATTGGGPRDQAERPAVAAGVTCIAAPGVLTSPAPGTIEPTTSPRPQPEPRHAPAGPRQLSLFDFPDD